ncbi:aminotransferase-like domain-containing protein [Paludibacterium paludis]|uniref:Putative 8-amino-7-oxononanoate synthase n=1 Tax=Paludibacterium paludis TaxID=1225769 RepID=A0A918P3U3_9NEIS|nr:PLP-dependent aminotransferase family protein [Paludibacterium paludis]GGY19019.1 hypothetical protein GCM10011289_23020 [Paludibacterium paludis]
MNKSLQLKALFAHAIEQGHLLPGDRMPSLRKVCQDHRVSMTTAQRAYGELERMGLIESCPRSGFRVLPQRRNKDHLAQRLSAAERAQGVRIEHLTMALPMPWGCPFVNPALLDPSLMNRALAGILQEYPDTLMSLPIQGLEELRRVLALHYLSQGTLLDGDELLITCGGMEALSLAIRAALRDTGRGSMAVLSPAFPAVLDQLALLDTTIHSVPWQDDENRLLASVEALFANERPAAFLVMANFHHPTGRCLGNDTKQALVGLAERYQVALIEDDTYRELHFAPAAPNPLKRFDTSGWVMHCASFSKSLAPGHRVGWIAGGRFSETLASLKLCSSLGTPVPSQMALARLLSSGRQDEALASLRLELRARCVAMRERVRECFPAGTRVIEPEGGYFLWVELPDSIDSSALLPAAMQQGIHFAPSRLFHATNPAPANGLRLNASFYDRLRHRTGMALLGELMASGLRQGERFRQREKAD